MLIDAHCHINTFDRERIADISASANNCLFIDSGINYATSIKSLELSKNSDIIFSAIGFHPFCIGEFTEKTVGDYRGFIETHQRVIAIGEVGLDHKADFSVDQQESIFVSFIQLAKEKGLTIIVHNRFEGFRVLEILNGELTSYEKVLFHCFSYSKDFLRKILDKNGTVSFSLNILRKKKELLDAVFQCPLNNLLLETDSPYMRIGNRESTPLDIKEVYSFASEVKGVSQEALQESTLRVAQRLFNLK